MKKFNPKTFIGKGWSIEEHIKNPTLDLNKIQTKTYLKDGEDYITGEERLQRMKQDIPLNADSFLYLWEHQDKIPKEGGDWFEFPGTILRRSRGDRYFLCLYRLGGGQWRWYCSWLGGGRNAGCPALVFASPKNLEPQLSSDTDSLVFRIKNLEADMDKIKQIINL
jgi:hypothetical protein